MFNQKNPFSFFIVFFFLLLYSAHCRGERTSPPRPTGGNLDLREYRFESAGPLRLVHGWRRVKHNTSETAFRLPLRLPGETPAPYALRIAIPPADYDLYVNGRQIVAGGRRTPNYTGAKPPGLLENTVFLELTPRSEILLITRGYFYPNGGLFKRLRLGTYESFLTYNRRSYRDEIFILAALLIMIVYHLGVYAFRPQERSPLLFVVFCVMATLRLAGGDESLLSAIWPSLPLDAVFKIPYLALGGMFISFHYFFERLFGKPDVAGVSLPRVITGVYVIQAILLTILPSAIAAWAVYTLAISVVLSLLYILYILARAATRGVEGAFILLAGFLVVFIAELNDVFYSLEYTDLGELSPYGVLGFIFCQALLLSRRHSSAYRLSEELAEDLTRTNIRLRSLDKLKDEFLANTSHELRTPLQGIIGIAQALRQGIGGEPGAETSYQLGLLINSARRLKMLVGDILDFSRLKNKDIVLRRRGVDLRRVIEVVLELNRLSPGARALTLEARLPENLPPADGDEDRILQILYNLVENAVKFTREGYVIVDARLSQAGELEVSVRDTGPGVPAGESERIFESFEQAESGLRSSGAPGTGLGLNISRALVELHGGKLELDPGYTEGARFYFTLPVYEGSPTVDKDEFGRTAEAWLWSENEVFPREKPVSRRSEGSGRIAADARAKILLADDEPVNLQVMENFLTLQGYEVLYAHSGKETLEILLEDGGDTPIGVVVLDIMLPGLSGFEVARKIRERYTSLELPVLMVSAKNRTDDLMAALAAGANDYLTKPFMGEELVARVRTLLALRAGRQERKRATKERNAAVSRVRKSVNADMHDHLGGRLTDLKFMSEELQKSGGDNPELIERIRGGIERSIEILRERLLNIEDLDLLARDFPRGIHMILLRRYSNRGRELDFDYVAGEGENQFRPAEAMAGEVYALVSEIVTNDLKYGEGTARWRWNGSGGRLEFRMESASGYQLEDHGAGRGTENLTGRAAYLGADLEMSLKDGRFFLRFSLEDLDASAGPEEN